MADTKVRRIKAKQDKTSEKTEKKSLKQKKVKKDRKEIKMPKWLLVITTPFRAFGRYVAAAFYELKQTHWPNRKTTWQLTFAVILFGVVFAGMILLIDYGFDLLMEMILNI